MSQSYAAEHYAASDPKRLAPARAVQAVAPDRDALAQRLLDWALEMERQDAGR